MKLLLIALLATASLNVFAISEKELKECPDYIQAEVPAALKILKDFDQKNIASGTLVEALELSVYGRVEMSPTCQEIEHMSNDMTKIVKELSSLKK